MLFLLRQLLHLLKQLIPLLARQSNTGDVTSSVLNHVEPASTIAASTFTSSVLPSTSVVSMSTLIPLVFTSMAFFLIILVFHQYCTHYQAHAATLRGEFKMHLDQFQGQVKAQLDGIDVAAIHKENDVLRAEIATLRRALNRNYDQRGEIEKAAIGISQLWSEVYRLRNDNTSAIIDYSTGPTSTTNSSGASIPQLTTRRPLVPNSSKLNGQGSTSSLASGNVLGAISLPQAQATSTTF